MYVRAAPYPSCVSTELCAPFRFHTTVSDLDQTVSQREATIGMPFSASHSVLR